MDLIGNRTLRDLLTERARLHPEKDFLIFEDKSGAIRSYGYDGFLDAVRRAAGGFASLGIGKGDAVVVHLANSPEFLISWLGLAWIGAVTVPSNTANTARELEHLLGHGEAIGFVTSPDSLATLEAASAQLPGIQHRVLARTSEPVEGTAALDDLLAVAAPVPDVDLDAEDVAEMLFTSGTTSQPKAVMLTHANCLRSGERAAKTAAIDETDRLITALPAFHVNAQSMTILAALSVGGTCVLLEEYRASKFWTQVREHHATFASLVAMQVRTLLAQPPSDDDPNHDIRRTFYAINVLDSEKEAFEKRYGIELMNGYGLSEAMTIVTMAPAFGDKRWPSIGLPAYDREVRIVDEDGNDVPAGTPGEIIVWGVPGRTIMKGYFKDPDATAASVRDGWLHTGDNGYFDELGYVYFFDRKKDVIKRAGENISASEVEAALLTHPDVAEAAVIGVPDPIRDEAVHAFVAGAPGATLTVDDVLEHCRAELSGFKVPTIVEIRSELPKTSIGKIEKKLLRQDTAEGRTAP